MIDPTATKPPTGYIQIGRLGRTFQLEGALRLLLDDAVSYEGETDPEPVGVRAVRANGSVFVSSLGSVRVRDLYENGGALLLKLEGVRDRNAAQLLVNASVWIDPGKLPAELAEELADEAEAGSAEERLEGRPVLLDGKRVGEVSRAMLASPNPVVEVTADGSRAKSLVPLAAPYVEITEEGVMVIDPPAGLLELG